MFTLLFSFAWRIWRVNMGLISNLVSGAALMGLTLKESSSAVRAFREYSIMLYLSYRRRYGSRTRLSFYIPFYHTPQTAFCQVFEACASPMPVKTAFFRKGGARR